MPAVAISDAAIEDVNCAALTSVVGLATPLNVTTEPDTKPEPLTVSVKAAPPAVALDGVSDVIATFGLLIVNWRLADVPPPGAALVTATLAAPAAAISDAVIAAVSWAALTKVVALAAPLNFTTEPETKPAPFTVSVNAAPPAVALAGESDVAEGAGLLMVNVCALEMAPPGGGFVTVTFAVPPVAI